MITENFSDHPDTSVHDLIEESRDNESDVVADEEWREYALGRSNPIADETRKLLLGDMDVGDIKENLIGQCLDQISGRMRFKTFTVEKDEKMHDFLDNFKSKNQLPRAIVALTNRIQTDGNAAMSVSWKPDRDPITGEVVPGKGRAVLHHESWWDGDKGMFVAVSPTGEVFWAVSEWYDRMETKHRTLYEAHRITRWTKEGDGWRLDREIEWTKKDGTPIGVPVAHFPNGASAFGAYAPSTVAQVTAAQDALNASLFNRQAVSAMTGSQIYWATGVADSEKMDVAPGTLWAAQNESAKFGALPPGSMSELLQETDDLRGVISAAFPVPSYRIGRGDWPSGLALQRSDASMIARVRMLADVEKPGLVMLAHRATEITNTFGSGDELDESAIIDIEWEEVDDVDPGTKIEIDTARVALYSDIERLTETMMRKTTILSENELTALIQELKDRDEQELANATPRF